MLKSEFDEKLNENIADSAEKVHFCFLSKIYTREDNKDVYELALVSKDFTTVQLYRTCKLQDILTYGYSSYDFSMEDHYLVCNPSVQVVPGYSLSDAEIDCVIGEKMTDTLFSFLINGCRENCVIFDDSVVDSPEDWTGLGVTAMRNIKFSKSTMSIYVPMIVQDGLYNKIISFDDNNKLTVKPFYYGIESESDTIGGNFVCRKFVNNIEYDIYKIDFLSVFDNIGRILSHPVINTAVQYAAKCEFVLSALDDMMHSFYAVAEQKPEWIGGSKQHTSSYKIDFSSTLMKLTKRDRINILNTIMRGDEPQLSSDIRVQYLQAACAILAYDDKGIPDLNSLNSVASYIKEINVMYNSYLMAIKYYLFCSHKRITEDGTGYLTGGAYSAAETTVKEGFK